MDFSKCIGKSAETEFTLESEIFRSYEEAMDREGFMTDDGDPLPPFGHWLYIPSQQDTSFNNLLKDFEDHVMYWSSGKISIKDALKIGENCKSVLKIKDIDSVDEASQSVMIQLNQKIFAGRSVAVDEDFQILASENSGYQEKRHRINFDPDWEIEIDRNRAEKYLHLKPRIFGRAATDILSGFGEQDAQNNERMIQGPPGIVLLLETFSENFESRKIESLEYKSFGVETVDSLTIACRDTDTYQTSMCLIDSRRQVLFSTEIQWNYSW